MSEFNLSVIRAFVASASASEVIANAFECEMIQWREAGVYPAVEDVAAEVKQGFHDMKKAMEKTDPERAAKIEIPAMSSLRGYASGMIKWAKAGQFPRTLSLRAFQKSVPGAKSTRGRKAKAKATEASAKATKGTIEGTIEGSAKATEPAALWKGLAPLIAAAINAHGDIGLPLADDEKAKVNEAARVILAFITAKAK